MNESFKNRSPQIYMNLNFKAFVYFLNDDSFPLVVLLYENIICKQHDQTEFPNEA